MGFVREENHALQSTAHKPELLALASKLIGLRKGGMLPGRRGLVVVQTLPMTAVWAVRRLARASACSKTCPW
jgi:hypothetical protein